MDKGRGPKRHISYNDKTWHSYTLPKEDQKNIWIMWHVPWVLLRSAFFHQKSASFAISENIDCILVHNFFFFWVFKDFFLVNRVIILMMSAKLATAGCLKISIFQYKGYDVIIVEYEVTNKNFIMWFKLYCRFSLVTKVW